MDSQAKLTIRNLLQTMFSERPEPVILEQLVRETGLPPEIVTDVADEIWPAAPVAEVVPFLLIRLGEDIRPGAHLSPEFHVCHSGWDGAAEVRAVLHGPLDRFGWNESPSLVRESSGYWIFHQSLSLTSDGRPCPSGEYRLEFDCRFTGSRQAYDSQWTGWMRFCVRDGSAGQTLEVESDGQGLVNLHGLNLKNFATIKFKAGANSLVNLQSFLSDLSDETGGASPSATAGQPTMIPVELRRVADEGFQTVERPVQSARIDLPSGRRILLFAQNQVILGRNRPGGLDAEATDIALRMMPRSAGHDAITRNISRQHVVVTAENGHVTVSDPRRAETRSLYPSSLNGTPLKDPAAILIPNRPHRFATALGAQGGSSRGIGLDITSFSEPVYASRTQSVLERRRREHLDSPAWGRDAARIDAVLIDRTANADEINGQESYLLVTGVVLIGSDSKCAIRLAGPGVLPEHALLCHWDGQFRLMAFPERDVAIDGRKIPPGQPQVIRPGCRVQCGQVEWTVGLPEQVGMDP